MGFEARLILDYDAAARRLSVGGRSVALTESPNALRGAFAGDLLLLASGPTAAEFPLQRYGSLPGVAMNGSIVLAEASEVAPFLYICDDPSFVRARSELALRGLERAQFVAMSLDCLGELEAAHPGCLSRARILVLERVNRYQRRPVVSDRSYAWSVRQDADIECGFSLWRTKPNRIGFSRNLAKGYFGARTIPFAALQVAFHLGFTRVFMVGVDLNPRLGRFYEQGEAALPSTLDVDYQDYILPSFALLARRVMQTGRFEVFNLSQNSRLPAQLVPKLSVSELDAMVFGSVAPQTLAE